MKILQSIWLIVNIFLYYLNMFSPAGQYDIKIEKEIINTEFSLNLHVDKFLGFAKDKLVGSKRG